MKNRNTRRIIAAVLSAQFVLQAVAFGTTALTGSREMFPSAALVASANDDTISLTNAPTIPDTMRKGGVVTVKGTVTSAGTDLVSLTAGVYSESGAFITGKTVNPGAKSYDLRKLDNDISFNKLTDGVYVFAVIATNGSRTNSALMSKRFVVGTGGTEATDPNNGRESVYVSNETRIPASIKKGSAVSVKGTVTSESGPISSVSVEIYDSNGNYMTGGTANVNAATYNLRGLDNSVSFNKLKDGSYTFRITAKAGSSTYNLSEQKFTVGTGTAAMSSTDPISVSGASNIPDSLGAGKSVNVSGTVTSASSNLTALTCGVFDSNNKLVTGKTVNPRSRSYDLSTLDYALEFNKLTAGSYTYCVIASNAANSNYTLISKAFTVGGSSSSNANTSDKITASGVTSMPSSIKKGGAVNIVGTVTSAESKMTALTVGVYDSAGSMRTGKTINPNAKSFDLSKLDSSVAFHKLPEGNYTFAVIASNAANTNYALVSKPFTVGTGGSSSGSSSDKLTISGGTDVPSSMNSGAVVNIRGKVTSASSNMTSLTCGVYNSSGKFVTGRTINPKSKSYDLAKFDSYVAFHKLPAGTYTYAVIASNGSNTNYTLAAKKFTIK